MLCSESASSTAIRLRRQFEPRGIALVLGISLTFPKVAIILTWLVAYLLASTKERVERSYLEKAHSSRRIAEATSGLLGNTIKLSALWDLSDCNGSQWFL